MITVTTAMPNSIPTIAPTKRYDALVRTGSRHARQLAATVTLLSVRPALAMPNSPNPIASQRVVPGWLNALSIWLAIVPVMPASSRSLAVDDVGEQPGDADQEQQHRHEEQEQPEGEGTADERARHLVVAGVHAHPEVDRPAAAVALEQLVRPLDPLPDPGAARATTEASAAGAGVSAPLSGSVSSDPALTTGGSSAGRRRTVGVRRRGVGLDGLVVGRQFLLLELVGLLHRVLDPALHVGGADDDEPGRPASSCSPSSFRSCRLIPAAA